jgi:hypothetical protein
MEMGKNRNSRKCGELSQIVLVAWSQHFGHEYRSFYAVSLRRGAAPKLETVPLLFASL